MNPIKQNLATIIKFVKDQSIFTDFSPSELEAVAQTLQLQEYAPGNYIIRENDPTQDLYFIKHGEVEVIQYSHETKEDLIIDRMHQGDIIGDVAFINQEPQGAAIRVAQYPAVVYKLSINNNNQLLSTVYEKILKRITEINLSKLRMINQNYTHNLIEQLKIIEEQNKFGIFFTFFFTLYSISNIVYLYLINADIAESQSVSLLVMALLIFVPTVIFLHFMHYPLSDFGLKFEGAISALKGASMITLSFFLFLELIFYLVNRSFFHAKILEIYQNLFHWKVFIIFFYALSIELFLRGMIQTSLQKFFFDRNKGRAVWVTALLIWPSQLYLGFSFSFIKFIIDVILGAIFLKQKNLAGVILIHFLFLIFF